MERPILFSVPIVRAILDERKTQTRRVIVGAEKFSGIQSFQPWIVDGEQQCRDSGMPLWFSREAGGDSREWGCKFGKPGDRLWVRETWFWNGDILLPKDQRTRFDAEGIDQVYYRADGSPDCEGETVEREGGGWKPSIHMRREYSRITLEIVSVRVERLQDISESDALSEGIERTNIGGFRDYALPANVMHAVPAKYSFETLWDSINAKRGYSWESNPFVWVLEFRRVTE